MRAIMKSFTIVLIAISLASMAMSESETIPDPVDYSSYTGNYGKAFMPYVPYAYNAYNGGYKNKEITSNKYSSLAPTPRKFFYGVPTGGLFMTRAISGAPIFYY